MQRWALVAMFLAAGSARAEEQRFGEVKSYAIGAERLFGLHKYKATAEFSQAGANETDTQTGTTVGFPIGASFTGSDVVSTNHSAVPRLAFDYFVADHISVGGTLGYFSSSGRYKVESGGVADTSHLADVSGLAFAPRAGYVLPMSEQGGFWLQGGIEYLKTTVDVTDANFEITISQWLINAQAMFFYSPTPHVALLAGPVLDYRFAGSMNIDDEGDKAKGDFKWTNYGLAAGILGYF